MKSEIFDVERQLSSFMVENRLRQCIVVLIIVWAVLLHCPSRAQTLLGVGGGQPPPGAGEVLQSLQPQPSGPTPLRSLVLPAATEATSIVHGGATFELQRIVFTGNSLFDDAALARVLGDVTGRSYDLAGLRELADRIVAYYLERGYPFTRVVIPPQNVQGGEVRFRVIESRYHHVKAVSDDPLVEQAQPFLEQLRSGDLMSASTMERAMLLLDDQPGIRVTPVVRPGSEPGTSDLLAQLTRVSRYEFDVGVDNFGSRYTGTNRARMNFAALSPFMLGERITASAVRTDENLMLGSIDYEIPLGGAGWRGGFSYSYTTYSLAKDFAVLQATGLAGVISARMEYPLIRSQVVNMYASLQFQQKRLQDRYNSLGTVNNRSSSSWPFALRYDRRDDFVGGGVTYGTVSWTPGRLNLDSEAALTDATSANKNGSWNKFNLDLTRVQNLPGALEASTRFVGQWSNKNLDASERLAIGGAYAVRAYPVGEGAGDRVWFAQFELRYPFENFTPFILYDLGRARVNANPWDSTSDSTRSLAGMGLGGRTRWNGLTVEGTLAWQVRGGTSTADSSIGTPIAWLIASYRL